MVTTELVPPDGGFAWVIMFALSLNMMITFPIMQGFGLLFKDRFQELGFTAADTAAIMNSNAAVLMFCGLLNTPVLRRFTYRKVALAGTTMTVIGVALTSYANSFVQYLLTYGLITPYGIGLCMAAYPLAFNMYFKKKRSRAMGYSMTVAGLGPIIMPYIYSASIATYGISGAVLIVSAISTHAYIGALLLQPIKWHMKKEVVEDVDEDKQPLNEGNVEEKENILSKKLAASTLSLQEQLEIASLYSVDPSLGGSVTSLYSRNILKKSTPLLSRRASVKSKFSLSELDECDEDLPGVVSGTPDVKNEKEHNLHQQIDEDKKPEEAAPKYSIIRRIGLFIVNLFDLSLLKDHTYVNIMIGMSFAVFAEMNFSILTPFIMQDFGLETGQIATFMSTIAIVDVCFRFIAPYVSELFKQPPRIMYMCSIMLLILSRSSLLFASNYYSMLGSAAFLGVAKGFRTVYWNLVIPDHVPVERLVAAAGIQSTFNSVVMWIGGSFLGYVRDTLGSFRYCIVVINLMSLFTILLWTPELLYKMYISRKKASGKNLEDIKEIQLS